MFQFAFDHKLASQTAPLLVNAGDHRAHWAADINEHCFG
jgi:hypothetical protein